MQSTVTYEQVSGQTVFPLTYPDNWWHPELGEGVWNDDLRVPKGINENLDYRRRVLKSCESDSECRDEIGRICRASPLFWMNVFGYTFRPKMTCHDGQERAAGTSWTDDDGVVHHLSPADAPIITWPAQDSMVLALWKVANDGGTLLIDKSRDQGATVITMAFLTWAILYWPRFTALVVSRKGELVDGGEHEEDSLFGKVDYMIKNIPDWMVDRPTIKRRHKPSSIVYARLGTRMAGETSGKDVGQSFRTTMTFVDEAARFPYGDHLMKSIETVSVGKVLASTPNGPGTAFSKMRRKADDPSSRGMFKIITLGYWDHPQKGRNRTWTIDHNGAVTGKAGTGYWETPAFIVARALATNMRDIRENWLIDHETSGMIVLDMNSLSRMRKLVRDPLVGRVYLPKMYREMEDGNPQLNMACNKIMRGKKEFIQDHLGHLNIWCDLPGGQPSRSTNYIIGADFAQGVEQSNTVLSVMDRETNEIVAEYVDPTIQPHEVAPIAILLGSWFSGQGGCAFIIWERNGPGISFGSAIVKMSYPKLYFQRILGNRSQKRTKQWGWLSTGPSKEILFSTLDMALRSGEFTCYSEAGIDDMASWMFDEYGRMVSGATRDLGSGAQARHGDRAIAMGLCVLGKREVASFKEEKVVLPPNSMGKLLGMDKVFGPKPQAGPFPIDHDKKDDSWNRAM